jgi:hypothetical protein
VRTNSIKRVGRESDNRLALQITEPARAAGLVEDDPDGDGDLQARRLADCWVAAVNGLLVVIDDRIDGRERTVLIERAAAEVLYRVVQTSVVIQGNGYRIELPNARDAGFSVGDRAPVTVASGLVCITDGDPTREHLADDLVTIRRDQVGQASHEDEGDA